MWVLDFLNAALGILLAFMSFTLGYGFGKHVGNEEARKRVFYEQQQSEAMKFWNSTFKKGDTNE